MILVMKMCEKPTKHCAHPNSVLILSSYRMCLDFPHTTLTSPACWRGCRPEVYLILTHSTTIGPSLVHALNLMNAWSPTLPFFVRRSSSNFAYSYNVHSAPKIAMKAMNEVGFYLQYRSKSKLLATLAGDSEI